MGMPTEPTFERRGASEPLRWSFMDGIGWDLLRGGVGVSMVELWKRRSGTSSVLKAGGTLPQRGTQRCDTEKE